MYTEPKITICPPAQPVTPWCDSASLPVVTVDCMPIKAATGSCDFDHLMLKAIDNYQEEQTRIDETIARSQERQYAIQSFPAVCMPSRHTLITSPMTNVSSEDHDSGWGQVFLFGVIIVVVLKLLAGN